MVCFNAASSPWSICSKHAGAYSAKRHALIQCVFAIKMHAMTMVSAQWMSVTVCKASLIAMLDSENKIVYPVSKGGLCTRKPACMLLAMDISVCIAATTPSPVKKSHMDAAINGIMLHTSMHRRCAMHCASFIIRASAVYVEVRKVCTLMIDIRWA